MNFKAVFFDFDYTLGDATESILAGFTHAFARMGLPRPEEEAVRGTVGYLLRDAYPMLTGDHDPARLEEFLRLFRERSHPLQVATVKLFPGARELLETLHAAGTRLGVVSSKGNEALNAVLNKLALADLLDYAVGGDMVTRAKPDPEGLVLGMAHLGLAPDEVLYCGDTILDAEAAQRAGAHFCAVLNGTTPAEAFAPYPCDHIAPELMELQSWLGL